MSSQRATADEAAAVEVVTYRNPEGILGVAIGIVSTPAEGMISVRLYSAGCVHDSYVFPADWVVSRSRALHASNRRLTIHRSDRPVPTRGRRIGGCRSSNEGS